MRKIAKKLSIQDIREANAKAMRGLMNMAGKPMPPELEAPERKATRSATVNHSDASELEAAVMREVGQLLAVHPAVLFAVRQNSGSVQMELSGGKVAPVWFYRWMRSKTKMRITDYWGMTTDGLMFAIECKRRSWTKPSGEREAEQLAFILTVKYAGGRGGFATSAEQAKLILESQL